MLPVLLPLPLGAGWGEGQRRWYSAHLLLLGQSAKKCPGGILHGIFRAMQYGQIASKNIAAGAWYTSVAGTFHSKNFF
jgi:hypothetical protein